MCTLKFDDFHFVEENTFLVSNYVRLLCFIRLMFFLRKMDLRAETAKIKLIRFYLHSVILM